MARTFDPKSVRVIYGGRILTGFMDGTFIEAENTADDFTPMVGSDGEGARIQMADNSGSVTLTLMQTSASNDYLSQQRAIDKATGVNTKSLLVKDGSGRTLIQATEAWIRKSAKVELANDKSPRVWVFDSTDLNINVGGNG